MLTEIFVRVFLVLLGEAGPIPMYYPEMSYFAYPTAKQCGKDSERIKRLAENVVQGKRGLDAKIVLSNCWPLKGELATETGWYIGWAAAQVELHSELYWREPQFHSHSASMSVWAKAVPKLYANFEQCRKNARRDSEAHAKDYEIPILITCYPVTYMVGPKYIHAPYPCRKESGWRRLICKTGDYRKYHSLWQHPKWQVPNPEWHHPDIYDKPR